MGLAGEAGEVLELFKKKVFGYKYSDIRKSELIKELSDVAWYYFLMLDASGITLEQVLTVNAKKLNERYSAGVDIPSELLSLIADYDVAESVAFKVKPEDYICNDCSEPVFSTKCLHTEIPPGYNTFSSIVNECTAKEPQVPFDLSRAVNVEILPSDVPTLQDYLRACRKEIKRQAFALESAQDRSVELQRALTKYQQDLRAFVDKQISSYSKNKSGLSQRDKNERYGRLMGLKRLYRWTTDNWV